MSRRQPFTWTPEADAALRRMFAEDFTTSGMAGILKCRHIEVVSRAMRLGLPLKTTNNPRLMELVAEVTRARLIRRAAA